MAKYKPVKTARAQAKLSDTWWHLRSDRLAADKVAAALKAEENEAKAALIASLKLSQSSAAGGKLVTVTLNSKEKPQVSDWQALWEYAVANDAPQLFQRRVGEGAVNEMWEEGIEIPGVEKFPVDDLSYSKIKE